MNHAGFVEALTTGIAVFLIGLLYLVVSAGSIALTVFVVVWVLRAMGVLT